MGYIRHNAIIVTGWNNGHVELARKKAVSIFADWGVVSEIVASPLNHYESFFIAPDGSKEGWPDSDNGNDRRHQFIEWMIVGVKADNIWLDWVEIQYGDDERDTRIVRHSDETPVED